MPNPFDELGDLNDAFAAIDEDVERRIDIDSPRPGLGLGLGLDDELHEVLIEAYGLILQADCDEERKRYVLGRMRTVMER